MPHYIFSTMIEAKNLRTACKEFDQGLIGHVVVEDMNPAHSVFSVRLVRIDAAKIEKAAGFRFPDEIHEINKTEYGWILLVGRDKKPFAIRVGNEGEIQFITPAAGSKAR